MRSSPKSPLAAISAAVIAGLLLGGLAVTPPAVAADSSYYVDNRTSADCSDTGPGTSPDAPWCTFAPAAALTLGPGESLLLARGAAWSEQLSVGLHGSATQPATIGAYGTGDDPRILDNSTGIGINLTDPNHAVVTGLEIGEEPAAGERKLAYGLMATFTTVGNEDFTLTGLNVHDTWQIGMLVRSTATQSVAQTALTGLTFSDIRTTGNAQGIAITGQGTITDLPANPTPETDISKVFRDVLVDRYYSIDDDANQELDRVSELGVPCVALTIQVSSDVVVRNSVLDNAAACRTAVGTTALFLGVVDDVLLANNVIVNTPNTMNPDMVAIDFEARTSDVTLAGNYFADNYGGAVEYLAIHGSNDYSLGHLTTGNVFVRNGRTHLIPNPGGGAISQLGNGPIVEATITDNLSYEPFGFLSAHAGGSLSGFTSSNNIPVDTAEDLFPALAQFGGDAWGYQSGAGATWTDLSYDADSATYTGAGTTIDRFTLTPSTATGAGLTWTAPVDGVVSLRGYPLAYEGTAAVAVTHNGATVTAADVGTSGVAVTTDGLTVAAGDVLRFSVAPGAGTVSWAPSIAYTSKSATTDAAGQWTFSVADDAQGWSSDAPATIARGYAALTTTAATTTLDSPAGLALSPAGSAVRLSYNNGTAATSGRVYFTTSASQSFTEARSVEFEVNPRSVTGILEGFQSVVVPLSDNAEWSGSVDRVRIVLDSEPGAFLIDSVELITPAAAGWEFDTSDGWIANGDVRCSSPGTPSAAPAIDVDNTAGDFTSHADINWNFSRMQQFTVSTPRLAQIDFWALKTGDPQGCLYFRVVKITDPAAHTGTLLFTGAVPASAVTESGGFVSIYPGLSDLDTGATYALQIFNPYAIPGAGTYGVAFSDDPAKPAASFGELYSPDSRGTWAGPETNRSLKFRTYTASSIAPQDTTAGFSPVTVSDGVVQGSGGYEPALLSPDDLGLDASQTRYIHLRMSNPDGRSTGYLLFTTEAEPEFDQPGDGWPVPNEAGYKGIAFSLEPGAELHEYVLDMSTIPGWTGTIEQILLEPATRWSYRIADLNQTWAGKIDYVRFAPDGLGVPVEPEAPEPDTHKPTATLVSPTTAGPYSALQVQVDASDDQGLKRIVANVYKDGVLVKSTQSAIADGATTGSHTATVALADGGYTVKYNAQDLAGNISATGTFAFTIDANAPTATVKDGAAFTVKTGDTYDVVSFKLYDASKVDKVTINGEVKDLTNNTWSDVNYIKPGVFGAVSGQNTLVVYDVAGNTRTVAFTLN
ncbi:hypothetical protein [Microbacterium allomyrinae]|uniref:Right handed beta helix domain-containing protein n=1 Tax=Microbacterium allomyrinae TaxID=2830666 RepID=A0A9X1LTT1_9MICO|nr:hypothetical protein [Microbacterium allomyrinae]MCC2031581.1 hypothetical protein [Microbacterium allomyrinae]